MKIVKVDATTSTNHLSRVLNKENNKNDFVCRLNFNQKAGVSSTARGKAKNLKT